MTYIAAREDQSAFVRRTDGDSFDIVAKHGIVIKVNGGSFEPNGSRFTCKLDCLVKLDEVETKVKEMRAFAVLAPRYGLVAGDYGAEFGVEGRRSRLYGLNPAAPKPPVMGRCVVTGKAFKFTAAVLVRHFYDRGKIAA